MFTWIVCILAYHGEYNHGGEDMKRKIALSIGLIVLKAGRFYGFRVCKEHRCSVFASD